MSRERRSFTGPQAIAAAFDVSRESIDRLEAYADLLLRWQSRINLIGRATGGQIWHRHIADCLQALPLIPEDAPTLVDVGSGAGLPGMVLAIALGDTGPAVHLIESNTKKVAFLREAVRVTGVKAAIHPIRVEEFDSQALHAPAGVVTARAFAPLPRLLTSIHHLFDQGTLALLWKGQDVDKELTDSAKYWRIHHDRFPSATDATGVILRIHEVRRVSEQD